MEMLDRLEDELRQEAIKLLTAADVLAEIRTGKSVTTRVQTVQPRKKPRRRRPVEVAPEPREPVTLDLGTATGLEESDVRESDLVHTTSEGNGRRRIA